MTTATEQGITFDGRDLMVRPPAYPAKEMKELGARWDAKAHAFRLPPTSLNVLRLVEFYGESILEDAPDDVRDLVEQDWGFRGFTDDERAQAQQHPMWDTLFDFQREGVEYLFCNPHAVGLVGLSWGLGKAATSIVAADLLEARRILVLAPLTLAPAWIDEFTQWGVGAAGGPRDIKRATRADRTPGTEVTIANHEVIQEVVLRDEDGNVTQPDWARNARRVKAWREEGPTTVNAKGKEVPARERIVRVRRDYLNIDWDLIIVDESVLLKNRKALKGDILETLRKAGDPYMFELSASPTTKFRDDLFRQLQILFPRAFTSYWRFAEFFCVVDKSGWGWTIEGDRPNVDPHHYLRDFVWIKSEDDAGIELPEYIESSIPVDAGKRQREALDQMIDEWIVDLEDEDPDDRVTADTWLARSTRLQQITSNMGALPKPSGGFYSAESAKEDLLIELLERDDLRPPVLVWTWFKETTALIAKRIAKDTDLAVDYVTGDSRNRDKIIGAFKDGELEALVLQMGVGKFGLTLTRTRGIFYHDRTFDADAYTQSRRRVRRIGLEHRPTLIVPKVQQSADALIDANLEGKLRSIATLTNADLADLLRSIQ